LTNIFHMRNNMPMKKSYRRKSELCFPITDAISAYVTLQRTNDAIHRHTSTKLAKWGLSVPKYGVMMQLYDHESIALSEIGNLIFRCNSNMTTLIGRMERDGLVEEISSDRDRRVKKIRLTKKGRRVAPKVIGEYRKFLHQMMSESLSPNEQRVLIDLLNRVKAKSGQIRRS
jgi:DNA-binding MarR family transcriptional regulator